MSILRNQRCPTTKIIVKTICEIGWGGVEGGSAATKDCTQTLFLLCLLLLFSLSLPLLLFSSSFSVLSLSLSSSSSSSFFLCKFLVRQKPACRNGAMPLIIYVRKKCELYSDMAENPKTDISLPSMEKISLLYCSFSWRLFNTVTLWVKH